MEGQPTQASQLAKATETRQQYATTRVNEWRAFRTTPVSFEELLSVFRDAGVMYDRGLRLRDAA